MDQLFPALDHSSPAFSSGQFLLIFSLGRSVTSLSRTFWTLPRASQPETCFPAIPIISLVYLMGAELAPRARALSAFSTVSLAPSTVPGTYQELRNYLLLNQRESSLEQETTLGM